MPIIGDITRLSGGDVPEDQEFNSGFFQNSQIRLEPEEVYQEQMEIQPFNKMENDWKTTVNRMLMKGMSADEIKNSIGEQIELLENAEEVFKYINKYEGLIGTIFLDSKVLEDGFSMAMIPKGWSKFHRFAINCAYPVLRKKRRARGGLSGDIDMFLSSSDENIDQEEEVCSVSGLPVLKAGMFSKETIDEIMETLGKKSDKLADLQKTMQEIALKRDFSTPRKLEFEKPDIQFNLKDLQLTAAAQLDVFEDHSPESFSLKENELSTVFRKSKALAMKGYRPSTREDVDILEEAPAPVEDLKTGRAVLDGDHIQIADEEQSPVEGVQVDWKKSSKVDVKMTHIPGKVKDVKMDDELRF